MQDQTARPDSESLFSVSTVIYVCVVFIFMCECMEVFYVCGTSSSFELRPSPTLIASVIQSFNDGTGFLGGAPEGQGPSSSSSGSGPAPPAPAPPPEPKAKPAAKAARGRGQGRGRPRGRRGG